MPANAIIVTAGSHAAPAPFLHGRRTAADAAALVREFGEDAMLAASMRAMQSRARDNARDYCHWREVERLLNWLDGDAAPATRH